MLRQQEKKFDERILFNIWFQSFPNPTEHWRPVGETNSVCLPACRLQISSVESAELLCVQLSKNEAAALVFVRPRGIMIKYWWNNGCKKVTMILRLLSRANGSVWLRVCLCVYVCECHSGSCFWLGSSVWVGCDWRSSWSVSWWDPRLLFLLTLLFVCCWHEWTDLFLKYLQMRVASSINYPCIKLCHCCMLFSITV